MPTYQRIVIKTPGGPDALERITEEIPAPEPDEIRVRVQAVGADATRFQVGQAVAGVTGGAGGYAEMLCHRAFNFVPLPEHVDPVDAVCVGLNGVMAYQMLHRKAHVQNGEAILVHGAAGGYEACDERHGHHH